jgi:ankyrin repeat protein
MTRPQPRHRSLEKKRLRHRSREQLRNREGQLDEGRRQGQFETGRELVRTLVDGRGVIPPGVVPLQERETALHRAAERGDVAAIAGFVGRPEFINDEDATGWTPLFHAAGNGRVGT